MARRDSCQGLVGVGPAANIRPAVSALFPPVIALLLTIYRPVTFLFRFTLTFAASYCKETPFGAQGGGKMRDLPCYFPV
jgi:hypothetical protein